jgi:hypothetical protein
MVRLNEARRRLHLVFGTGREAVARIIHPRGYYTYTRTAPVFRPLAPEETALVREMLALANRQSTWNRWMSRTDMKTLLTIRKRGTLTERQARMLSPRGLGNLRWWFERAKRWKSD